MAKDTESPVKKRRKTAQPPSAAVLPQTVENIDLYQKVVDFEEEEAQSRNADRDEELYIRTCNDMRKAMIEIHKLKLQKSESAIEEIVQKRTDVCLLFVILKKLNRLDKCFAKNRRDLLFKMKQQVDSKHLQLQNLLYETLHLKKVVNKCFQFKSKDEEIDLVSVEEFYEKAPEGISRPVETKNDPHLLKLARLEWELEQRKQLSSLCHKLQNAKENVSKEIVAKQERLENITPQLHNILETTKPLQEYFNIPLDKIKSQHRAARLLPAPLFVLYEEADAYKTAWDNSVKVLIVGDEDAAQNMGPILISKSDDDDSDQENTQESGSHRRRASSRGDPLEERRARLLKLHPLSVEVTIFLKDDNAINVTFHYMPYLSIVTVKPKVLPLKAVHGIAAGDLIDPHRILSAIVPNDIGLECPNKANKYQLKQVGLDSLPADVGIPYLWAQQLAGLDVSTSFQTTYVSVERLFRRIKKRLNSRLALCRQIQQLEGGSVAVPLSMRDQFPVKLCSTLTKFSPIVWEDYSSYSYTQSLIEDNVVESTDSFYKAVLTRNTATLTALITVKANYPAVQAIFCLHLMWQDQELTADNDDDIKDMERQMNVYCDDCPKLLAAQLTRLQASFDILLECSSIGSMHSEFPRDKIFFQPVRGRVRAKPYKYLQTGGGIFVQQ